eukprot:Rmarinus@m.7120
MPRLTPSTPNLRCKLRSPFVGICMQDRALAVQVQPALLPAIPLPVAIATCRVAACQARDRRSTTTCSSKRCRTAPPTTTAPLRPRPTPLHPTSVTATRPCSNRCTK